MLKHFYNNLQFLLQRGVFNQNIRACNRNSHLSDVAPIGDLERETSAFSIVLDTEMQLRVSLSAGAIHNFSSLAARALLNYIRKIEHDYFNYSQFININSIDFQHN